MISSYQMYKMLYESTRSHLKESNNLESFEILSISDITSGVNPFFIRISEDKFKRKSK